MNTHTRYTLPPILRALLLGVAIGVVVATGLLLLCALLMIRLDLPEGAVAPMALTAAGLGALASGIAAGLYHKQMGLLMGAVCGTLWYLILLVAGLVRVGGIAPGYAALKWAVLTVCSAAGGVWGVNRRHP